MSEPIVKEEKQGVVGELPSLDPIQVPHIPKAEISSSSTNKGGNLLSNVLPPAQLPNFIPSLSTNMPVASAVEEKGQMETGVNQLSITQQPSIQSIKDKYAMPQFEAAIPTSKGFQYGMTHSIPLDEAPSDDFGGLIGWMKGAIASNGILAKVAEKAKNSMDSMITTLDPQMKEFIYSGGEVKVLVATDREEVISAIREAFQDVFGKATLEGDETINQTDGFNVQPRGFAASLKAVDERAKPYLQKSAGQIPVVAIQSFLINVTDTTCYELSVLLMVDPLRNIRCNSFTQMTLVPASIIAKAQQETPDDYAFKADGYAISVASLMARSFQNQSIDWHLEIGGVSQRETIYLAAKVLASNYKNEMLLSSAGK